MPDLDHRRALIEDAGSMLAVRQIADLNDALRIGLVINPGALVCVDRDLVEIVRPAGLVDVPERRREVEPEDRVGVQIAVEDRQYATVRQGRIDGLDDPNLDVGVQHRVGPADPFDVDQQRLGAELACSHGVIAFEGGAEPLSLELAGRWGAGRHQCQVGPLRALVGRDRDRRLRGTNPEVLVAVAATPLLLPLVLPPAGTARSARLSTASAFSAIRSVMFDSSTRGSMARVPA